MNYRHAFHAGNFADVLKHAVLAAVLRHLCQKESPFRVIDTHAGVGRYDLMARESERTGEWLSGIARLFGPEAPAMPPDVADALQPYLACVAAENPGGALRFYPGSPRIARHFLRPGDRLVVNELHPEDCAALRRLFPRDRQVKVLELDAWIALKALLPPKERRGVILIDPPFEQPGELERLSEGLREAVRRFATGIYVLWYPIKDRKPVARFHRALADSDIQKIYAAELFMRPPRDPSVLNGCGLAIVNPPHPLVQLLPALCEFLAQRLAGTTAGSAETGWVVGERS